MHARNQKNGKSPRQQRRALVLLAVLVVVMILSLLGYQYLDLMTTEYRASENVYRSAQTRMLAESGVQYAAAMLSNPIMLEGQLLGNPYDEPDMFGLQPVFSDDIINRVGLFSIVAPIPADGGVRYGVIDESGKININAMIKIDKKGDKLYDMLSYLPDMPEGLAAAIVDWVDEDGEARQGGAEDEAYASLDPPYHCKNGPLDTIDELLLVRDMTPELLFGGDFNRNGMIDANEPDIGLGLSQYLTVWSREQNTTRDHKLRININEKELEPLHKRLTSALGAEMANYIILYRQYGGSQIDEDDDPSKYASAGEVEIDFEKSGRRKLRSLLDLVNSRVRVQTSRSQPAVEYVSPLYDGNQQETVLPLLFDKCSTTEDVDIPARININTAPIEVLRALPDISEEYIEFIVANQPTPDIAFSHPTFQTPAWIMTQADVPHDEARKLERFITTRSQVYKVQVIGYFEGNSSFTRLEAVIDTNAGRPRILSLRDLTALGRGFALEN